MRYQTTADILQHASELHAALAARYERMEQDSRQERIRMLLDYLARHEKQMAELVARFGKEAAAGIRNAWFKYAPEQEFLACVPMPVNVDQLGIDELVDAAIHLDDCIIDLYQLVAMRSDLPEARAAFQDLVRLERDAKKHLVRQAMGLADL